jgi:glycosyltransferase involved in cell wall biosynthesis
MKIENNNESSNLMDSLPKISIVTPSFNQGKFLEETLLSILGQGYPNLEYVVIDGGSSDQSVEIIQKYAPNLHYWHSKSDKGHGDALNQGFIKTSGEIMAWLNSDDKYYPWTLRAVAEIFSTFPEVNWIVGFNSWWNDKGVATNAKRVPKNIYDFLIGDFDWIQQESVFWRRGLWEKAGGQINENYKLMVDGELWTRFFLHDDLYIVDCLLGGYRSHGTNRAHLNYEQCLEEMRTAIAIMKDKCPDEVISNYNDIIKAKKLKANKILNMPIIGKLIRGEISKTKAKLSYPYIHYRNGNWTKANLPFGI